MSQAATLDRLIRLNVRDHWSGEATDFTPWLARPENIALLSEAIGLELEVVEQEQRVGPFRADIVCTELGTERKVLIENQLERTDHVHLGQLLTYAAGLQAVSVVWIAERFTEEHRAALDWLNRVTDDGIDFFGIEIELWRIGSSLPAPKFNLVAKPNEWSQTVSRMRRDSAMTETGQLYLEYWTAFRDRAVAAKSPLRIPKPAPQGWTTVAIGRSNFFVEAAISRQYKEGYVQLMISGPDRLAFFRLLEAQKTSIEGGIGFPLEWRELPEKAHSQVRLIVPSIDPDRRDQWPAQHDQLRVTLERFSSVFSPLVKGLDPSTLGGGSNGTA